MFSQNMTRKVKRYMANHYPQPNRLKGDANQNVLVGQRPGDTGGQQMRYGGRARDFVRARQATGRPAGRGVFRNVSQGERQRQGACASTTWCINCVIDVS